ncbi:hypothetical protein MRX96_032127 [Rhipicephalus microplus]
MGVDREASPPALLRCMRIPLPWLRAAFIKTDATHRWPDCAPYVDAGLVSTGDVAPIPRLRARLSMSHRRQRHHVNTNGGGEDDERRCFSRALLLLGMMSTIRARI